MTGMAWRVDGHGPPAPPENRQPAERLHAAANRRLHGAIGLADGMALFVRQAQQNPDATSARERWPR